MTARSALPLGVAGAWLAVDAQKVLEIVGPSPIVALPGMPRPLPGVTAFRGRAVAVLDAGALLGVAAPLGPGDTRPRTVLVQAGPSVVALPADAVREVLEVPEGAVAPPGEGEPWSTGRVEILGSPAPILDPARALPAFPST